MPYIKLTTQSELPGNGEAKEFEVGDKTICVANVNGTISAMDNVCLHMGGPLGQGYIEGNKLVCPWHGWEYDPKTGELKAEYQPNSSTGGPGDKLHPNRAGYMAMGLSIDPKVIAGP